MASVATLLSLFQLLGLSSCFNLDVENPFVQSGIEGSYFGFAVDFFKTETSMSFLLIGAPKANTSQPGVIEGGEVIKCDWKNSECQPIVFDPNGNRNFNANESIEFKSHQWFGASVRAKHNKIMACAPLYHWRTELKQEREPVGTCFLKDGITVAEYAPCRSSSKTDAQEQGFCQGGFSIDFTKADRVLLGGPGSFYWQGQLISDQVEEILNKYKPEKYSINYDNQLATRPASQLYDDSYLGKVQK
ncbi:hypothetical protein GDO86_017162 [Hymenochirus boettgeri]|uniref:Uncharacterized protein n=1 Tax=Hymenochirus boettgeri TaxID=247094 RepID=A0A8T2IJ87_9PIPI|nr:hypothetical protein GDO86_017162 [Hymenochirus boettgeri]